jgi:nucleoside-diphosphate-sugar epimerase
VRVFVAGASGAIGRLLVPRLVAAGHEVIGMTRSEERAEAIRAAGARAVVVDVFDVDRLQEAVASAGPEAMVHELTSLPDRLDFRKEGIYEPTNRVRTEGTRNLLDAARGSGVRRFVCQSIAFAYALQGSPPRVLDEDAPLNLDAPPPFSEAMRVVAEMERAVLDADGLVLRYGWFYGPGTSIALDPPGSQIELIRKRRFPIVGAGSGVWSFVHIEDAATATLAAIEGGPSGVYNIVDDEPATVAEYLPALAAALGAKPPWRVPRWVGRLAGGKATVMAMTEIRGASNEKAKRELGWQLRYPSWRQGFVEGLG